MENTEEYQYKYNGTMGVVLRTCLGWGLDPKEVNMIKDKLRWMMDIELLDGEACTPDMADGIVDNIAYVLDLLDVPVGRRRDILDTLYDQLIKNFGE